MFKIGLAQINPIIGDIAGNTAKIDAFIEKARSFGCQIVVFPELALTGYPPQDLLLSSAFCREVEQAACKIARQCHEIIAIIGLVRPNLGSGKPLYNSAAICKNGQIAAFQDKTLLPTYDLLDERRYFEPAQGSRLFECYGRKFGITICEDMWQNAPALTEVSYTCNPIEELASLKPEAVFNLSSSPFSLHKVPIRQMVAMKAAQTASCPFLLCNQVGGNDSLIYDGNSLVYRADGKLAGRAAAFVEDLLVVDIDALSEVPPQPQDPYLELFQALSMGVADYFHKQGFTRAHIGLSGGIDSSVVACIATKALGRENVMAYYLPSHFSSDESRRDAYDLARNLGIALKEMPIDSLFTAYKNELSRNYTHIDVHATLENIQARIRCNLLMAASNITGSLLLNTSNKSELSMGYSTLYGDMAGALAVIGDLFKTDVYALAHRINQEKTLIPPYTLSRPPTAELRSGQLDSDTLPEYSLLDPVLKQFIEKGATIEEIALQTGYSIASVKEIVKTVYRSEYKRRQAPMALRVSEKCFCVGRVVPIVQKAPLI